MRTWQVERRKRTRHLIELGGLVVKAGIVDLIGDDRAIILGALLWMADKLQSDQGEKGTSAMGRKGKGGIRCGTGDRCAHHHARNAAGSGMTDGARRGDSKYRSAARHRAGFVFNTPRRGFRMIVPTQIADCAHSRGRD